MHLRISIAPNFSRHSTHLLCPSAVGAKYDKALEWNVPVVDTDWLITIATTGIVPSPDTPVQKRNHVKGFGGRQRTSTPVDQPKSRNARNSPVDVTNG